MDTLLVSVRLFGFVITLIFLIVQIVNQKKKKTMWKSLSSWMKANKNSLRHKPWLGSVLGKQKEDSWAFRTNILSQSVPLSNRQSPQQTPSARLSTQHRTLEFMERRFRISPHFKLLNLKVCALGVTSFWSRTRDLRWLSLMWSQWWSISDDNKRKSVAQTTEHPITDGALVWVSIHGPEALIYTLKPKASRRVRPSKAQL